jgi:hypothetical protein
MFSQQVPTLQCQVSELAQDRRLHIAFGHCEPSGQANVNNLEQSMNANTDMLLQDPAMNHEWKLMFNRRQHQRRHCWLVEQQSGE